MPKERKTFKKSLEITLAILTLGAGISLVGSILGFESNLKPLSLERIKDTSFQGYSERFRKKHGNNIGIYALSIVTYPGARLGAEVHNYGLPENR